MAYITDLNNHCIHEINLSALELTAKQIKTGPFPEGIAITDDYIFAANSGYGDYYSHLPKARHRICYRYQQRSGNPASEQSTQCTGNHCS